MMFGFNSTLSGKSSSFGESEIRVRSYSAGNNSRTRTRCLCSSSNVRPGAIIIQIQPIIDPGTIDSIPYHCRGRRGTRYTAMHIVRTYHSTNISHQMLSGSRSQAFYHFARRPTTTYRFFALCASWPPILLVGLPLTYRGTGRNSACASRRGEIEHATGSIFHVPSEQCQIDLS
ncbi:hypothetical protein GE09DRAFT_282962 [Coniochaeta sp. 2T2.1]|nr:hypothetical protein GE09DRAFT_282962 [Coniochaeta sp. 2T2.1]